jgi:rhamnosyltransferase
LGDPLEKRFLWRAIHSTNHGALRKYYMTRNRLYMRKHFPEFRAPYLKMVLLDALKVLLIEDDKRRKIECMMHGALDFMRGNMGKWDAWHPSTGAGTRSGRGER